MRHFWLLLVLPISAAFAQPESQIGRLETATEVVYYDIDGATVEEISASLNKRSPSKERPKFFGVTEWEVNAEYRWVERPTGCTVEGAVVRLVVRTHLPRWRPRGTVEAGLRQTWHAFVRDLGIHETHHRTLIEEAGEALRWELVSLREPTCATMEAAADRVIAAALGEGQARNEAYDRETGHGRTQGAVWPPMLRGTR